MKQPNSGLDLGQEDCRLLAEATSRIDTQMARLRAVAPYVIDMSSREAALSSPYGHTLQDKIDLYDLGREIGLSNFGLSNFFAFPSVSDQFLDHLMQNGIALDPFFVTIAVEPMEAGGTVPMGPAAQRTHEAGIPNVILLIEMRPSTIAKIGRTPEQALADICSHIAHYRDLLPGETDRRGRLYVRVADPFDAFDEDPEHFARVFKVLGAAPISGILFEDVKGSRFQFEARELIGLMRHYNPVPRKILVHPHSGNGMEDAAVIDAILAGADGVWSGFTPQAAQGGHGSALMFLTNLMRAGNRHVEEMFDMKKLRVVAEKMWQVHDRHGIPPNTPVVGRRAYRYVDQCFEQTDEPCDLDPVRVGVTPSYQVTPSWAPTYIIGQRLRELGYSEDVATDNRLLTMMRTLINESLCQGHHAEYDDPEHLAEIVHAAQERLETAGDALAHSQADAALTMRYR